MTNRNGLKSKRPIWSKYTKRDEIQKIVPVGFTAETLAVKEVMDNACDAAEQNGGEINICFSTESGKLIVTNSGTLTEEDFDYVTDFSKLISDKYLKKSLSRGAIGHGLKIAIMLITTEDEHVFLETGGVRYSISLRDPHSEDPRMVLNIQKEAIESDGRFSICFHLRRSYAETDELIRKYIAINPHLTFVYNNEVFEKTISLKKDTRVDIHAYSEDSFSDFLRAYSLEIPQHLKTIVPLFASSKNKTRQILSKLKGCSDNRALFQTLQEHLNPVRLTACGRRPIQKRLLQLGIDVIKYKKVRMPSGIAEIAILDTETSITGLNQGIMSAENICIEGALGDVDIYLDECFSKSNTRNARGIWFLFSSTDPHLWGINKDYLRIPDKNLYASLKNLQKCSGSNGASGNDKWVYVSRIRSTLSDDFDYIKREVIDPIYKVKGKQIMTHRAWLICIMKNLAEEMADRYGAITVRQLYYQLVSKGCIENSAHSYIKFDRALTEARESGVINPELIADRSRTAWLPNTISALSCTPQEYVHTQLKSILTQPALDMWENQKYHVELWIEKDALFTLFSRVAQEMQIAMFPSRGYTSVTKLFEATDRFLKKIRLGKKCVVLYAGDLDPSGYDIYKNIKNKLYEYIGKEGKRYMDELIIHRFALLQEQVAGKKLIPMFAKEKDTRRQSYLQEFAELEGKAYELDAMDPDDLITITKHEVKKYFDESRIKALKHEEWLSAFNSLKEHINSIISTE